MASTVMRDCHHLFLQTFMSHGCLSGLEVHQKYREACKRFTETDSLINFLLVINTNLRDYQLELKKAINEYDGSNHYVLINKWESDITKMSTEFSMNELDLFKKLLDKFVTSVDGMVSSVEALNLTDPGRKSLSKNDAEEFYTRLVRDKWLCQTTEGRYYLSPRSIAELEQYVLESWPDDAVKCHVCEKLCIVGQRCSACNTVLHLFCSARLFRGKTAAPRCPSENCNAPWPHTVPLSPRATPAAEVDKVSPPALSTATQLRKRRK